MDTIGKYQNIARKSIDAKRFIMFCSDNDYNEMPSVPLKNDNFT